MSLKYTKCNIKLAPIASTIKLKVYYVIIWSKYVNAWFFRLFVDR